MSKSRTTRASELRLIAALIPYLAAVTLSEVGACSQSFDDTENLEVSRH